MTWLGTPLVDPKEPVEAWMCTDRDPVGAAPPGRWRFLEIRWISDGPVAAALIEATDRLGLQAYIREDFDQPFLRRREDGNYTSTQSKRHLSDYRRRARRLSELLGAELHVENVARIRHRFVSTSSSKRLGTNRTMVLRCVLRRVSASTSRRCVSALPLKADCTSSSCLRDADNRHASVPRSW